MNSIMKKLAVLSELRWRFSQPRTLMTMGLLNWGSRLVKLRLRSTRDWRVVLRLMISYLLDSFLLVSSMSFLRMS
jgi:hypothetical protein